MTGRARAASASGSTNAFAVDCLLAAAGFHQHLVSSYVFFPILTLL